jgi:1-deoxy-D-xylulose 5-phosphate reductoisomerase
MKKKIIILGSTGSIGKKTFDLIKKKKIFLI